MKKYVFLLLSLLPFLVSGQANNPNEIGLSNVDIIYFSSAFDEDYGRDAYYRYLYYVDENGVAQDNLMDGILFMDLFYNNREMFMPWYKEKDLNYYLDNIFTKTKLIETRNISSNNVGLIDKRPGFGISNKGLAVTPCELYHLQFDIKSDINIGSVDDLIMTGIEFLDINKNNIYIDSIYNGSKSGCSTSFTLGDTLIYSNSAYYGFYYKYFDLNPIWETKNIDIIMPHNAKYINFHILNRQVLDTTVIETASDILIDNVKLLDKYGNNKISANDSNFNASILTTSFEQANYDSNRDLRQNNNFLFKDRTPLLDELLAAKNLAQNSTLKNKTTKVILSIPSILNDDYLGNTGVQIKNKIFAFLDSIEIRYDAWSLAHPNSHIELDGIYFMDEGLSDWKWENFTSELLPEIKAEVASKGWKFYGCPYNDLDDYCTAESGYGTEAVDLFDVLWQQPNSFFSAGIKNRDRDVIKVIMPSVNSNNMGVEIESRVVDIAGGEPYGRINDYFDYGNKFGYVNFSRLHYDSEGAYYVNSKSNEPIKRQDYDNLYNYINEGRQGKIVNHDFEHIDEDGNFYNWGGNYTKNENTFSKSKNRDLEFQNDSYTNPIYTETFPLKATQTYSIHCQIKENFNDNSAQSGLIGFYFYDKNGNIINPPSVNGLLYTPTYGCWYKYMNPTTVFSNFDHTFTTPSNTVTVKIILTEWQTQAIITWKDLKLKDLTTGAYTPEQFYKGLGNDLKAETKIYNGKYSLKLGNNQSAYSKWKMPITPNINYTLKISAKELLPILNETSHSKALVGIKCYDKNGVPLSNAIPALAYSSTLGMNYFYIYTLNQVWNTHEANFSFPSNVASVKFHIRNWNYNNTIVVDNFELETALVDQSQTIGDNILTKEGWGESFPLTASFEKPVFYNKLIPVTDFQEFEFSALMKKTGYDELPHLLSLEFFDVNNNIITSSTPMPSNLLWSSVYKYWFSNLPPLENDECGDGTNESWFLNKWKMVNRSFTVPKNARWMRMSIETFSSNDIKILNPILKTTPSVLGNLSKNISNENELKAPDEDVEIKGIDIYPNPTSGVINIYLNDYNDQNTVILKIYDIYGKLLYDDNLTSRNNQIDISNYSSGVYLITINLNSITLTKKIIIL